MRTRSKELRSKMTAMVNEANALRNEAAKKMYNVPKGYKFHAMRDYTCYWLKGLAGVALGMGCLWLLQWSMNGDSVIHVVVCVVILIALFVITMSVAAAKNRPYKAEEHVEEYFINEYYYDALVEELKRLKTGIADYDCQYAEQKEYIEKFIERRPEVDDYGSLKIVLKANDFHAQVKMKTGTDEVDCRLKFTEEDYGRLMYFIEFFDRASAA